MKPFNLEEAKAGKKVVTRDGREFIYAGYNPKVKPDRVIVGWVDGNTSAVGVDGHYLPDGRESNYDLFMATETNTVWIHVYHPFGVKGKVFAEVVYKQPKPYSTTIEIIPIEFEV